MQIEWQAYKKYLAPVFVLLVGIVGWFWLQSPSEAPIPTASIASSSQSPINAVVTVYITGKVLHPGVIELPVGSRVIDAVNAAGGLTIKLPDLNLARVLVDGEEIVVTKFALNKSTTANGKVNLNQADLASLETIPGIGPVMAQRIIDYRELNGTFHSLNDLDAISGIGPALMAEFQKSCVVE